MSILIQLLEDWLLFWYSILFQGRMSDADLDYVLMLTALVWVPPLLLMGGGLRRLGRKTKQRWARVLGAACMAATVGNLVLIILLLNQLPAVAAYNAAVQKSLAGCGHFGYPCDPLPLPASLVHAENTFTLVVGLTIWWLFAGYIIFLVGLMELRGDWEIPDPAVPRRP